MFTPKIRLLLAVAAFLLGAYRLVNDDALGLLFLAGSGVLAYGYFRYGTVWLAFRAVARGNTAQAQALLAQVKRPDSLGAQERAYFELASGLVCAAQAENGRAEAHLEVALQNELRTDNDRALAEAVLAQLLAARGERARALEVVERAATRDSRPAIAARLKALHGELRE